ncbi:MAG: FecCD family ABC transporter permease [Candidatus Cryptobacteroides sp.]
MTRRGRLTVAYLSGAAALAVLALADLCCGSIHISLNDLASVLTGGGNPLNSDIVTLIRLPRILSAAIAGACLALSGAQMQALFRNPLADPHILGLSAGAGTGAALYSLAGGVSGIAAGVELGITTSAALGALFSAGIIAAISAGIRRSSSLLLAGVMLGFIMGAITSIIEYQADETSVKIYWNWAAGSFSGNTWTGVSTMAVALTAGAAAAMLNHKGLTALLFGEDFAISSGQNVNKTRTVSILSCCILTGAATAFCGPVGFVGIIAPHITRWVSGRSAMRETLPLSLLYGASVCLAGDILSQLWSSPLPVGSTIAILGIPVIFYLIFRFRD